MDLIDKKIICALDENCRKPISQLAHELRISRSIASYRIKNLEEKGIISKYICSISLGLLGYKTYKIYFKVQTSAENQEREFINFLVNNNHVIHCLKTEGSFDYSAVVAVKNVLELDNFISEIKTRFTNILKDYAITIVVYTKIYKLNKLLLKHKERSLKIDKYSGEENYQDIDEKDKKIIHILSQKSNISILEIAEKTNLSIDVVKYRLKKLTGTIINSFRAIFNLNKLGYYHYVLLLKMRQATKKDEENLLAWCASKENVLYSTKRIGYFDFEINAAITDINDLNDFLSEFKKKFPNIIDSYELIINSQLLKLNYVPF